MSVALNDFERWLEEKLLKPETIGLYLYIIDRIGLDRTLSDEEIVKRINTFIIENKDKNIRTYTSAAVRHFLDFAEKSHLQQKIIKKRREEKKRIPEVLTYNELLDGITLLRDKIHKWAAIIQLETGLRAREVLKIRKGDVKIHAGNPPYFLVTVTGKRGKTFQVAVTSPDGIRAMLDAYRAAENENSYLFVNSKKHFRSESKLLKSNYQRYWADLRQAFNRRISSHDFRRAYALRVYATYRDLKILKMALHHEDISTSERYIEGLMRNISPIAISRGIQNAPNDIHEIMRTILERKKLEGGVGDGKTESGREVPQDKADGSADAHSLPEQEQEK